MKKCLAVLAVALLASAPAANAQSGYWWVGAAASMPTGDAADVLEAGYFGSVGVGINISSMTGISLNAEGLYGSHSAKIGSGSTSMTGFFGNVEWEYANDTKWMPYVFAGYGSLSMKPKGGSSDSNGAWQVGGGFGYRLKDNLNLWGDVRYMSIDTAGSATTLVPIAVGISMPWGNRAGM